MDFILSKYDVIFTEFESYDTLAQPETAILQI